MPTVAEELAKLSGPVLRRPGAPRAGFLLSLARAADTPARNVREFLTGIPEATGTDILRQLTGIQGKPGEFDLSDIPAFGLEVATDPATLVGGFGGATKAGKLGAQLTRETSRLGVLRTMEAALKAAGQTERAAKVAKDIAGVARGVEAIEKIAAKRGIRLAPLGKTIGERARLDQAALLTFEIPFTNFQVPLVRGAPVLEAAGRAAGAIGRTKPAQFLKDVFITKGRQLKAPAAIAAREIQRAGHARIGQEAQSFFAGRSGTFDDLAREAGISRQELNRLVFRHGETTELVERIASAQEERVQKALVRLQKRGIDLTDPANAARIDRARQKALKPTKIETGLIAEKARIDNRLAALGQAGQRIIGATSDLKNAVKGVLDAEIALGARSPKSVLRRGYLEYLKRTLSPEARILTERHPEFAERLRSRAIQTVRASTTRTPDQLKRSKRLLNRLTADISIDELIEDFTANAVEEFERLVKRLPASQRPLSLFELDPVKAATIWIIDGEVSTMNALYYQALIKQFAVPEKSLKEASVWVGDFARKAPLHTIDGVTIRHGSSKAARRSLSELGLEDHVIPREVADAALQVYERTSQPRELAKLAEAGNAATALIKYSLTVPFPGFHSRNILNDLTLSWVAGSLDLRQMPRAILAAIGRDDDLLRTLHAHDVIRGSAVNQIRREIAGIANPSITQDALSTVVPDGSLKGIASTWNVAKQSKVGRAYRRYTNFSETFTRALHFLSEKAKGASDFEAASSVKRWLFDYSELTPTERKINKVVLFYNWSRNILPRLAASTFSDTNRMAFLLRLSGAPTAERGEGELPAFIRESAAIPAGKGQFLTAIGSPLEELNKLDFTSPEGGILGTAKAGLGKIAAQLNPLLKVPIEVTTGKDLFRDEDILSLDRAGPEHLIPGIKQLVGTTEQTLPGGQTRLRGDPLALHLLRQAPVGRALRTAGQAAEVISAATGGQISKRVSTPAQVSQILTGIRAQQVDAIDRLKAEEDSIQDELVRAVRDGKAGVFKTTFAKGDEAAKLTVKRLSEIRKERQRLIEATR